MSRHTRPYIERILDGAADRWRVIATDISDIVERLDGVIGDHGGVQRLGLIRQKEAALKKAILRFDAAVQNPSIIIATTGTTSSGKSTLANMLIGDFLLPKGVQEVSAGVVSVEHHDKLRRLTVEPTEGATWTTGTWDGRSAEKIREHLSKVMEDYRTLLASSERQTTINVAPPRFTILWPTRMGLNPRDYGLPEGARLTIIDLPGLKYVGDDLNGKLMREQARKAFCIIAYNAQETDTQKQESLLGQVVDQVKQLGGTPARMLFVLNKIDVFRTDENRAASEERFTQQITGQIRARVSHALPGYEDIANGIIPTSLSSEPALFAMKAETAKSPELVDLIYKLESEYGKLFDKTMLHGLHRDPERWSDVQRRWFLGEALQQSRFNTFRDVLASHIASNLPELLLPDLIEPASLAAQEVVKEIDALRESYCLGRQEDADKAQASLEALYQRIQVLQKEALDILRPFRDLKKMENGNILDPLRDACGKVADSLKTHEGKIPNRGLHSIPQVVDNITDDPINRLMEHVIERMDGKIHEDQVIEATGAAGPLYKAIVELLMSPYGPLRQEHQIKFEEDEASQVAVALAHFAQQLSKVVNKLIEREATIQGERLREILAGVGNNIVDVLQHSSAAELDKAGFIGLSGVFRGGFDIGPPKLPSIRFEPDISKWKESRSVEIVETQIRRRRTWRRFWLFKSDVEETKSVWKQIESQGIETCGLLGVLDGFTCSLDASNMDEAVFKWIQDCITGFDRDLCERLKHGVSTYRAAFALRDEEISKGIDNSLTAAADIKADVDGIVCAIKDACRPNKVHMAEALVVSASV